MLVVTCVKQVPDTTQIKVDPNTGTLIREGVPFIMNPFDAHALEESMGKRINMARVEEALKKDPRTVCVCCPYCMTMFEDGLKSVGVGEKVQVLDLAEIVARALPQQGR